MTVAAQRRHNRSDSLTACWTALRGPKALDHLTRGQNADLPVTEPDVRATTYHKVSDRFKSSS